MVAGSRAQEERAERDSAGGGMPVIADGDGEQVRVVWVHSAGNEVPVVALENEKEKVYSQLRGKYL